MVKLYIISNALMGDNLLLTNSFSVINFIINLNVIICI